MYTCNDVVCAPVCDFCWFCKHGEYGIPEYCIKGNNEDFYDGLGYCDEFKCRLHEEKP